MSILKFKYVNQPKIWGEEDWIISAHENGDAIVEYNKQEYKFSKFYEENKSLFGINDDKFPLLVKIITAKEDLSIQVHPNDEYAQKKENSLGKTECWYVLDAKENADIIVGIKSQNKEELKKIISAGKIEEDLNIRPVKKGDFLYIPSGCVHAIRANTKLLEIQQSSDITYRLYDYNRPDKNGDLRDLHIQESLDVIDYNYKFKETRKMLLDNPKLKIEELVKGSYFYVDKYQIKDSVEIKASQKFKMIIALDEVKVNGITVKKNEGVVILIDTPIMVEGTGEFILSGV